MENALAIYGAPIYVRHEVVHNRYVVDSLRERGAIFIEQISEVPDGAILIFSAHGVSQAVRNEAKGRDLTVLMRPARWSRKCIWKLPAPAVVAKNPF